ASDFATGAVLQQDHGRGLQPVAYLSHKMSPAETRYPTHDKEMLAIVNMLGEWRPYLQGRQPFTIRIHTDHNSLQYFMTQPSLSARQARWLDKLADFDFKIEYVRGVSNTAADALSRRADHARPEAGSLAALTLASLERCGQATLTKAELRCLPLFGPPTPATLLAVATRASAQREKQSSEAPPPAVVTQPAHAAKPQQAVAAAPAAASSPVSVVAAHLSRLSVSRRTSSAACGRLLRRIGRIVPS
ncbi:MAG: hypothetical protein IAI48_09285, partial [Candidatus Eremiobacteraeota bacterium]|nr:hypothetical protein [Candidatus Eremiobacteraeota bacterium]